MKRFTRDQVMDAARRISRWSHGSEPHEVVPPTIVIARHHDGEEVCVTENELPDYSECPVSGGWEHVAVPVFAFVRSEPLTAGYRDYWLFNGHHSPPDRYTQLELSTGDIVHYCSPQKLAIFRPTHECWPEWDGKEPDDDCVRDWQDACEAWFADVECTARAYEEDFDPKTCAPKDPDIQVYWFILAPTELVEAPPGFGVASNYAHAIEQAAQEANCGAWDYRPRRRA